MKNRILPPKPIPQPEHQIVGILEVTELVAHMKEKPAGDECLEGQYLVEFPRIFTLV